MVRIMIVFIALLMLPEVVLAASIAAGYIGLYVDNAHVQTCVPHPISSRHYTVWSWCQTSDVGVQGASFDVLWSGNLYRGAPQYNWSIIDHTYGHFVGGMEFTYSACQYGWHWIHKEDISQIDPTHYPNYLYIEDGVAPHQGCVRTCQVVGEQWRQFVILTNVYFGYCSPIGTEGRSWGAIKDLYRE